MDTKANALLINAADNVVTVVKALACGEVAAYRANGELVNLTTYGIPAYHKAAICDIRAGETVYKYGQEMGVATQDIKKGEHVHTHNIKSKVQ